MRRKILLDFFIIISLIYPILLLLFFTIFFKLSIARFFFDTNIGAMLVVLPAVLPIIGTIIVRGMIDKNNTVDYDTIICEKLMSKSNPLSIGSFTVIPLLCYLLVIRKNSPLYKHFLKLTKYLSIGIARKFLIWSFPMFIASFIISLVINNLYFMPVLLSAIMCYYCEGTAIYHMFKMGDVDAYAKYSKLYIYPYGYWGYFNNIIRNEKEISTGLGGPGPN